MHTVESLDGKSNAELCAILTELGGVAPTSGKFRTRAAGIAKVLEAQSARVSALSEPIGPVSEETLPPLPVVLGKTPETRKARIVQKLATVTDSAERRKLRKKLRRITQRAARQRRVQAVFQKRTENAKFRRLKAAKLAKTA